MSAYPVFKLEDYLSQWEFKAPFLFCCSDSESMSLQELLELADPESLSLWNTLRLGYTEAPGHPLLRGEIAKSYDGFEAEDILTFSGAEEGIFCAMQALLEKGDHVIVITPCYQSLKALPQSMGAEVTLVALEEDKDWALDLALVKKAMRSNTKMIVINFPHNPTGSILDHQTFKGLLDIAKQANAYVFSDEVYRLLEFEKIDRLPPACTVYEKAISLSVTSKSLGLAGLRVGWIATKDRVALDKMLQVRFYTSICNSAPSEILALIALRAQQKILARNLAIIQQNLVQVDDVLNQHSDLFSWVRPKGSCTGFVKYHGPHSIEKLAEDLVLKEGVLILPGHVYDVSGPYFRIGFGRKNMGEALKRFERYMDISRGIYD
jgi:aspartate/methionine/tyrosine aminotransferase